MCSYILCGGVYSIVWGVLYVCSLVFSLCYRHVAFIAGLCGLWYACMICVVYMICCDMHYIYVLHYIVLWEICVVCGMYG